MEDIKLVAEKITDLSQILKKAIKERPLPITCQEPSVNVFTEAFYNNFTKAAEKFAIEADKVVEFQKVSQNGNVQSSQLEGVETCIDNLIEAKTNLTQWTRLIQLAGGDNEALETAISSCNSVFKKGMDGVVFRQPMIEDIKKVYTECNVQNLTKEVPKMQLSLEKLAKVKLAFIRLAVDVDVGRTEKAESSNRKERERASSGGHGGNRSVGPNTSDSASLFQCIYNFL